jgi:hypothetical protein
MKSKPAAKRSNQSQDPAKSGERSATREETIAENKLLKFLRWDKELDPASVAIIAFHLDSEACRGESSKAQHSNARAARREVLVRAALFLGEARDIVANGPNLEDLPTDLQRRFLDDLAKNWASTAKLPTPKERFRARAMIITAQKRPERAVADLQEYVKHDCKEFGRTDTETAWDEFVRAFEAEDARLDMAFDHLSSFPKWKQNHKSETARQARSNRPGGKKFRKKVRN